MKQTDNSPPLALVIEDDQDASFIISSAFTEAGFHVVQVYDGAEALRQLNELKPDLITLDMHLPHVSGAQILHQIRADNRLAGIEVMLLTVDFRMAESVRSEANWVMIKPITFPQIRELAQRLMLQFRQDRA